MDLYDAAKAGRTATDFEGPVESDQTSSVVGEFERMLDDKGRVTVPPRLRETLGTSFVTARGTKGSVLVIPASLWPEVEQALRENAAGDDRYAEFAIHNHTQTSLDRQGRLKLPKHLLEWAGIEPGDAAAIIASGQKFEVRNSRVWGEMQKQHTDGTHTPVEESRGLRK